MALSLRFLSGEKRAGKAFRRIDFKGQGVKKVFRFPLQMGVFQQPRQEPADRFQTALFQALQHIHDHGIIRLPENSQNAGGAFLKKRGGKGIMFVHLEIRSRPEIGFASGKDQRRAAKIDPRLEKFGQFQPRSRFQSGGKRIQRMTASMAEQGDDFGNRRPKRPQVFHAEGEAEGLEHRL